MQTTRFFRVAPALLLAACLLPEQSRAQIILGDPPQAPTDLSRLPRGGPVKESVTGGFSVDTTSREQVRDFYNAVYTSSDGVPMDSTADVSTCTPGTNSTAFQEAVLRRINWFRAMAGVPASITLNATDSAKNQQGAVLMSANNALSHFPPPTWVCFSGPAADAASNSNIALGSDGADAISGYIWDFGANNYLAGHRRWLLYPQTQMMGTGDVPAAGTNLAANTTWVFDGNYGGPRPATRQPYVAWPPPGYVPYPVVYPQWSLGLSNANLSASTVTMTSNGVSVSVSLQPYTTGYGENTLVWVPMGLDPTTETAFPFDGTDTVYSVTVNNIKVGTSTLSVSYNVTVFDPATPGADYVAPVISGPAQPVVNTANGYSCQPVNDPNATGYQWRLSQSVPGNLTDNAQNGLANFTISPPAVYPIITNAPDGSGSCFHLVHFDQANAVPQLLQLNELLFPGNNTTLSFESLLGYATSSEIARVQVSTDGGGTWQDLYTQPGSDGSGESTFTPHTLSLAGFSGRPTLLRFNYDFQTGGFYIGADPWVGWCLENIVLTNTAQLVNLVTNATPSTAFTFTPTQAGSFNLEARALIFTEFPLDWGPPKALTVVPAIVLSQPLLVTGQVRLYFSVAGGAAGAFQLLEADQLGAPWTTNTTATLSTNVPGSSYRFTTATGPGSRFYRVRLVPGP